MCVCVCVCVFVCSRTFETEPQPHTLAHAYTHVYAPAHHFSVRFHTHCHDSDDPKRKNGLSILRKHDGFVRFAFRTVAAHVSAYDVATAEKPDSRTWEQLVAMGTTVVAEYVVTCPLVVQHCAVWVVCPR